MNKRSFLPAIAALGAGFALVLAAPLAASAHVDVEPNTAEAGASARFTFSALNESSASTIKVEVQLPTDTPIVSVTSSPTPGWTTTVIREKLDSPAMIGEAEVTEAITRIVFEAEPGNGIRPGEFQEWRVSMSPIPDAGSVIFPSLQTYDDGEVVEWTATAEEIEADATLKPAPVLYINDEPVADSHGGAVDEHAEEESTEPSAGEDSVNTVGAVFGISALVMSAIALTISVILYRRGRATA